MVRLMLLACVASCLAGCGEPSRPAVPAGLPPDAKGAVLRAGVAKVEITDRRAVPFSDPLFVKALVLKRGDTTAVLVTLDAVAVGEIGHIRNDYLGKVRSRLQKELSIPPESLIVNAS